MAAGLEGLVSSASRGLHASIPENPYHSDGHHLPCGLTPFGCMDDFWCNPEYGMSYAGYTYCFSELAFGKLVMVPEADAGWLHSHGTQAEFVAATACQYTALSLALLLLSFYAYSAWKATCGWEEGYVCCVEVLFVTLEISNEFNSPATLYLSTGNYCYFLRYGEWLLSCPVILIHLSNLSGLKNDYSMRTMRLLVSCIGMLITGMAGGLGVGWVKWTLYFVSCAYSAQTYLQAAKCYVEVYATVPKGYCRTVVKLMAYAFFTAWGAYPILWAIGPEGLKYISGYSNTIAHTFCDILAKEIWTFLGHHLRIKIHEHILIHGDIRKKVQVRVAGELMNVEELMEEEGEDTV
nr:CbChR1 [synthetic construct]